MTEQLERNNERAMREQPESKRESQNKFSYGQFLVPVSVLFNRSLSDREGTGGFALYVLTCRTYLVILPSHAYSTATNYIVKLGHTSL